MRLDEGMMPQLMLAWPDVFEFGMFIKSDNQARQGWKRQKNEARQKASPV